MAITLSTTLRNARADQITTVAGATAKLTVYTAAYAAVLYTSTCAATLAPAAAACVLTFNAVGNATATGAGTAAIARLFKTDGTTMVIEGLTVGTAGTNIIITNTTIAINDVITTFSATITEGNP